jgi:transposase InsO family protein
MRSSGIAASKTRYRCKERDMTCVRTAAGWLIGSPWLDFYSRKRVGVAMRRQIETALARGALQMTLGRRSPSAGLSHHPDRGSQDASHADQRLVKQQGIRYSRSGQREGLDHAVAGRWQP